MSMIDRMDQSLMPRRAALQVASAFAVLALLLAAVGAYGLVAYSAAFRRREIGLRLALGSPPRLVFWRVFSEGARVIAVGLSLGLATAAALGGYIDSQLYGVTATDPTIIGLALLVLAASGLVAAMLPAVRAARADPSDSLRAE
jgi:ABC-type antimicrobial peptide transport system permease subunit